MVIYGLYDENGCLRYVGQTVMTLERRLAQHCWPSSLRKPGHKNNWISSMLSKGERPSIGAIQKLNNIDDLNNAEIYWISYFKNNGCDLTNDVAGGIGLRNPSRETRARMSAAKIGKIPYAATLPKSEKTREKIRQIRMGTKASAETKAKMSRSRIGQKSKKVVSADGVVYNSMTEVADTLKCSLSQVWRIVNGKAANPNGLKYLER